MSEEHLNGSVRIDLPPSTPISDKEAALKIDAIRRDDRVDAAIAALGAVLGKSNLVQRDYAGGGSGSHDLNNDYSSQFENRLRALVENPKMTVHQAANQVIRELGTYDGQPGDGLSTRDFDKVYHGTLDRMKIPQLKHDNPSTNEGKKWQR